MNNLNTIINSAICWIRQLNNWSQIPENWWVSAFVIFVLWISSIFTILYQTGRGQFDTPTFLVLIVFVNGVAYFSLHFWPVVVIFFVSVYIIGWSAYKVYKFGENSIK